MTFWREDVRWYSAAGPVDFSPEARTLAYCLRGLSQNDNDLYVLINAYWEDVDFAIQEGYGWKRVVDTSLSAPRDVSGAGKRRTDRGFTLSRESPIGGGADQVRSGIPSEVRAVIIGYSLFTRHASGFTASQTSPGRNRKYFGSYTIFKPRVDSRTDRTRPLPTSATTSMCACV